MSSKTVQIFHSDDARKEMLEGINILEKVVGSTLGSQGKNVLVEHGEGRYQITKDGVTVAKSINLSDPLQNLGVQLIRTVTEKTGNFIGDGTTSSTVLTAAICNEGYKLIQQGINTIELKKALDFCKSKFVELLEKFVVKVPNDNDGEMAYKIATISSNYDEDIALTLKETFKNVGKEGIVVVDKQIQTSENSQSMTLELISGFRIESGFINNQFTANNSNNRWEGTNCKILVIPHEINTPTYIQGVIEQCAKNSEPVLVIAEDISGDFLARMIMYNAAGTVRSCGIKSPSIGEERAQILEDLCIYTGAKYLKTTDGRIRNNVLYEDLGTAAKVIVERTHTTIINGHGDVTQIATRCDSIKSDLDSGTLNGYQETYYRARRAQLLGKVAMIKVRSQTDADLSEKLDRVDDAIHATKSAITYGYVAGGGATLYRISKIFEDLVGLRSTPNSPLKNVSDDFVLGVKMFIEALKAPISRIITNTTGETSATSYLEKIVDTNVETSVIYGFNANTSSIVNMIEAAIIDPYEIVKSSVIDAASVAGIWLTTDAAVINNRKEAQNALRDLLLGNMQEGQ